MAETALALGLKSVPLVTEHYDKVYDPLKDKTKQGIQKVKKMRQSNTSQGGGYESETDEEIEYDGPPRRNYTEPTRRRSPRDDGRRRSRRDYDDIVEERFVYKGPNKERAKSIGRDSGWENRRRDMGRGSRRDYSDSESSISPRPRERRKSIGERALVALGLGGAAGAAASSKRDKRRSRSRRRRSPSSSSSSDDGYYRRRVTTRDRAFSRGYDDDRTPSRYKPAGYLQNGDRDGGSERGGGQQVARRDNRSEVGSRGRGESKRESKRDSSSSSTSDVCSSSEDERRTKKLKGKEYLTAGLAAVATIHAAHSVYASMEARDKRHIEVAKGEMTAEEARKKKNKARIQDAAAIGIAALGIKGAYSEWQEVQENRHMLAEVQEERKKNHEKRMRRIERQQQRGGNGRARSEGPAGRRRDRS